MFIFCGFHVLKTRLWKMCPVGFKNISSKLLFCLYLCYSDMSAKIMLVTKSNDDNWKMMVATYVWDDLDRDQSPTLLTTNFRFWWKFLILVTWQVTAISVLSPWNLKCTNRFFGIKDWNKLLLKYRRPKARSNGSENSRL